MRRPAASLRPLQPLLLRARHTRQRLGLRNVAHLIER